MVRNGVTTVVLPQLPVGSFVVAAPDFQATISIRPEAGTPVEIAGRIGQENRVPVFALVGLVGLGLTSALLLRRRPRLAALGVIPVVVAAALTFVPAPSAQGLSWEGCDVYSSTAGREGEILRRDCRVRALLELLRPDGSGRTEVAALLASTTEQGCHEIAHLAGFYFSRLNAAVPTAARGMILGCNDGMVHGVLEAIGMFSSDDEFIESTATLCRTAPSERERKTCAHGLGHAALWRTIGDLDTAWDLCQRIEHGPDDNVELLFNRFRLTDTRYSARVECLSASVMEWADRWEFEQRAGAESVVVPDLDEPMDICTRYEVEEAFQVGCYLGTNYRTRDPGLAAARCNSEAPYPVSCFATLGDNIVLFNDGNLGQTRLTVDLAARFSGFCTQALDPAAAAECVRHLALRFQLSVQSRVESAELCAAVRVDLQAACQAGVAFAEDVLRGSSTSPTSTSPTSTSPTSTEPTAAGSPSRATTP